MLVVEARALVLLFVPADLAGVYDASCLPHPNRVSDPTLLLSAALLAGVFVLALRLRRRAPLLTLAIGLHFVALAPTYQLIPIPVLFGERFLYLALPGLCLGVAVLLSNLRRPLLARAVQAAVFAVCVWFAGLSHARAYDWHDPVRFWRATLKVRPNSLQAHIGLAEALRRERRCAEALPHYEASMWLAGNDRRHRLIWGAAASCFSIAGDPQRSRAIIEAWLARHPGDAGFRAMRATLAGAGQR
jgi:hypothetical protein